MVDHTNCTITWKDPNGTFTLDSKNCNITDIQMDTNIEDPVYQLGSNKPIPISIANPITKITISFETTDQEYIQKIHNLATGGPISEGPTKKDKSTIEKLKELLE